MKIWKKGILILGAVIFLGMLSISVSAETVTDGTGDVYKGLGSTYALATDDKPNVDVTEITFDEGAVTTTMTMTVNGVIEDSDDVMYWGTYFASEEATYTFSYTNGNVVGIATTGTDVSVEATASVSGNKLTVEFDSINIATEGGALYGYAATWLEETVDIEGMWMDYAPGSYSPWYTAGNDGTSNDGTSNDGTGGNDANGNEGTSGGSTSEKKSPGFEILMFIAAVGIAIIIFKKKKYN